MFDEIRERLLQQLLATRDPQKRRLLKRRMFALLYGEGENDRTLAEIVKPEYLTEKLREAGWTHQRLGKRADALKLETEDATLLMVVDDNHWPLHSPRYNFVPVVVFYCEPKTLRIMRAVRSDSLSALLRGEVQDDSPDDAFRRLAQDH